SISKQASARPTRVWRKKIGPGDSKRTTTAMRANSGARTTQANAETTTSVARLIAFEERDRPKRRTPSRVIPSTSSNSTEEPTAAGWTGQDAARRRCEASRNAASCGAQHQHENEERPPQKGNRGPPDRSCQQQAVKEPPREGEEGGQIEEGGSLVQGRLVEDQLVAVVKT